MWAAAAAAAIDAGMKIGGMVYGANEAENAASRAAKASGDAAWWLHTGLDNAMKEREAGRDRSLSYLSGYDPFISSGLGANNLLQRALGIQGSSEQKTFYDQFQDDPGYQATLRGGTNAIETSQSGGGLLRSGGTLKALMDYGARLKGGMFNNRLSQLAGLSASGQQAAGARAGLGANIETGASQDIAGYKKSVGEAYAGGVINASNADQRATQNLLQILGYGGGALKPQISGLGNDLSSYFKGGGGGSHGGFGGGSFNASGAI
jgi:hypothetical protein